MQDLRNYGEFRCCLDPEKMAAYENYIADNVKDKVVADLGTGPGVLAWLALTHGAKKVYIVDYNKDTLKTATEILKPWGDKVVPIHADLINHYNPAPEIDIFIHEILGHVVFDELIPQIWGRLESYNALHKHMDMRFEFFEYRCHWNQVRATYDANNFSDSVAEYHRKVIDMHPGLLEECMVSMESIETRNYIEYNPFYKFDIKTQPIHECFNQDIVDKVLFEKNFGWRCYLGDYSFTNIPRLNNNWFSFTTLDRPMLKRRVKAFYQPVVESKNPYKEDTCPFLQ